MPRACQIGLNLQCCSSSSLCFLGCPTFEEVGFRSFDICGAQCGLPILFLVTDIHTLTARTEGSCLVVVENTGLVKSRASSPVLADISAVTFTRSLLTEELLQSLIRKLHYVGLFSQIQRQQRDEICTKADQRYEICTKPVPVSGLWHMQFLRVKEASSSGEWSGEKADLSISSLTDSTVLTSLLWIYFQVCSQVPLGTHPC